MGKRTRFLASDGSFPSNVIYLEKFRRSRWLLQQVHLLYVAEDSLSNSNFNLLKNAVHAVNVVSDEEALTAALGQQLPDIILIESGLKWIDPVALTCTLAQMTNAPLMMVCTKDTRKADRPGLLKRAFAVGLQDTLHLPLRKEEVEEALEVLIKYRSVAISS